METRHMMEYERWMAQALEDPDLHRELESIAGDEGAIRERFAIDLSFGTAGLRGIIGAGTNRMNIYVVRRATQGLANQLLAKGGSPHIAIAYDSRIKSDLFAREVACVMAANGITAHIYPTLQPVPTLSFAVRELKADAGVMVTASHNPAKYNGYKVYGPDGCQLSTEASAEVLAEIEGIDIFTGVKRADYDTALAQGQIRSIPESVLEAYFDCVKAQSVRPGLAATAPLKLVYSPLNGTGNLAVRRVLGDMGFRDITVVPEQELPDGNFPTCPFPNPEEREALDLGLALAKKTGADLMLATDPDADRVGIAVRDKDGEYHLLTGNEVGVLLLDYIASGRAEMGTLPKNPIAVKSIVTTPMADKVAKKHGVEIKGVLTGFKYIGELIAELEAKGQKDRFLLGFEESYGYLIGTHVRDKDAVVASMMICEMAAYHNSRGSSLYEALNGLYAELGRFVNVVESCAFEGVDGMDKMKAIMDGLRAAPPADFAGYKVLAAADLAAGTHTNLASGHTSPTGLPPSNVLIYTLEDDLTVIVRPSGTEPKIKVYYTTKGRDFTEAEALQQKLSAAVMPRLK